MSDEDEKSQIIERPQELGEKPLRPPPPDLTIPHLTVDVAQLFKRVEELEAEDRALERGLHWLWFSFVMLVFGGVFWAIDSTASRQTAGRAATSPPGAATGNPEVAKRTALAYVRELYPNQENQTASCNCEGLSRRQCSNRGEGWCWCGFGNPSGTRLIFNICCDGKVEHNEGCWP